MVNSSLTSNWPNTADDQKTAMNFPGTTMANAYTDDGLTANYTTTTDRTGQSWDDATWILTSSFIIFTMQSGFGMLESGCVSHKNQVNIMMKNVADVLFGGISYWMVGYGLSFGNDEGSNGFCGFGKFFLDPVDETTMGTTFSHFVFQASFATTATTIVSGAVAERVRFTSYLVFSFFNTFIYCFPAHWVWDHRGWLHVLGVVDVAGDGPVHVVGGVSALVAAIMIKPRHGRFTEEDNHDMESPVGAILGLFILWWSWLAFNCGSTYGISGGKWKVAARSATNTLMAANSGGIVAFVSSYVLHKKFLVRNIINGILASLVAITASCAVTSVKESLAIGGIGAGLTLVVDAAMPRLRVDDPVSAFAVHGVSGVWGLLATGLFAHRDTVTGIFNDYNGLVAGGGFYLLGIQTLAAVSIVTWTVVTATCLLKIIDVTMGLRPTPEEEERGADFVEHDIDHKHHKPPQKRRRSSRAPSTADITTTSTTTTTPSVATASLPTRTVHVNPAYDEGSDSSADTPLCRPWGSRPIFTITSSARQPRTNHNGHCSAANDGVTSKQRRLSNGNSRFNGGGGAEGGRQRRSSYGIFQFDGEGAGRGRQGRPSSCGSFRFNDGGAEDSRKRRSSCAISRFNETGTGARQNRRSSISRRGLEELDGSQERRSSDGFTQFDIEETGESQERHSNGGISRLNGGSRTSRGSSDGTASSHFGGETGAARERHERMPNVGLLNNDGEPGETQETDSWHGLSLVADSEEKEAHSREERGSDPEERRRRFGSAGIHLAKKSVCFLPSHFSKRQHSSGRGVTSIAEDSQDGCGRTRFNNEEMQNSTSCVGVNGDRRRDTNGGSKVQGERRNSREALRLYEEGKKRNRVLDVNELEEMKNSSSGVGVQRESHNNTNDVKVYDEKRRGSSVLGSNEERRSSSWNGNSIYHGRISSSSSSSSVFLAENHTGGKDGSIELADTTRVNFDFGSLDDDDEQKGQAGAINITDTTVNMGFESREGRTDSPDRGAVNLSVIQTNSPSSQGSFEDLSPNSSSWCSGKQEQQEDTGQRSVELGPPLLSVPAEAPDSVVAGHVDHQHAVGNGGRPAPHHSVLGSAQTEGVNTVKSQHHPVPATVNIEGLNTAKSSHHPVTDGVNFEGLNTAKSSHHPMPDSVQTKDQNTAKSLHHRVPDNVLTESQTAAISKAEEEDKGEEERLQSAEEKQRNSFTRESPSTYDRGNHNRNTACVPYRNTDVANLNGYITEVDLQKSKYVTQNGFITGELFRKSNFENQNGYLRDKHPLSADADNRKGHTACVQGNDILCVKL